jgi:hypothetical protein
MSLSDCTGPYFPRSRPTRFQMIGVKEVAAANLTAGACSLVPHLPTVGPNEPNGSGYRCQPAIGVRVCAKQALANGFFNECERFLGLSRFGFSNFGTKLYGRQLILLSFNTGLGLFQRSARILQLTFGGDDEFTLCPLGGLHSHFGKPQSF